ncbi:hypothetical protein QT327_10705 [Olivibacter sp. 47]|uniref:hypothetical protein n=1 Tax=Olivibacter sp. 47 TaxID=3056486 RepID=UPI0025A3850D|nr:hypothetical protein [Olivibacter sp. 47]MDM8174820.1 hypothetical protein [Olivibacter sp. 47]
MKIIHLNLKRECVLVELPREITHFEYGCGSDGIYLQWHDGQIDEFEGCIGEHGQIKLSENSRDSFKRLGKFTDLKRIDFEGLVHEEYWFPINGFKDYNPKSVKEKYLYLTPKDSFVSAIKAEGWYTENPLPDPELTMMQGDGYVYYGASHEDFDQYARMEEKVINLSNCYLFVKL